jgi:GMP synthase (glutamine-hydrolysing)
MRRLALAPLNVLLVQCRIPGSPILQHEMACVAARLRMTRALVTSVNVVEDRLSLHLSQHPGIDALILGGSGEFSVVRTPGKWLDDYLGDLRQVLRRDLPIFGICFGLQALVAAMGGDVIHDPELAESGIRRLTLTAEGHRDGVFGRIPGRFQVLTEHQDRVARLPAGMEILARGRDVSIQAVRVAGIRSRRRDDF